MSGQTMTTVLKWALYLCGAIAVSDAYMTRIDQCEPIEIPKCRAMPYNMTQMPNLVHHNTQENARLVFEKFEVLLEQNCSDSLLFLLCSIYVPICAVSLQPEAIPPCRSVCEKAKAGCEPLMNSYNVSWPESLDCSRLPRYERGVCVSPEAFVKPVKPKKGCTKCRKKKLSWSNMKKHNYNYAVKVQMVRGKRVSENEMMYKVKLAQVIFSGRTVKFPATSDVTLWVNATCACPKLHRGREYLIMGHAEGAVSKLLMSPLTIVTAWKESQATQINKWHVRSASKSGQSQNKKKKIQPENKKQKKRPPAVTASPKAQPKRLRISTTSVQPLNLKPTHIKPVIARAPSVPGKTTESSAPSNVSDFLNGYTHGGRYYTKELAKKYNQATLRAART